MSWPQPLPGKPWGPSAEERAERGHIAALAAHIFAAAIDHAPHAHAFEYDEAMVMEATRCARAYAVAQARALLEEVDTQLRAEVTP